MSNAKKAYRGKQQKEKEAEKKHRMRFTRPLQLVLMIAALIIGWALMSSFGLIPTLQQP